MPTEFPKAVTSNPDLISPGVNYQVMTPVKRTKVLILVNTLQSVSSFVYGNHVELLTNSIKRLPNVDFMFYTPHRMSIDNARNSAAAVALEQEFDYLLFIDDDVMLPANAIEVMLAAKKDVCAGLVIIRGMPFNVMGFKYENPITRDKLIYYNELPLRYACSEGHMYFQIDCEDCRKTPLLEMVEMAAVGFSCCLIDVDLLKAVETPFFVTGRYSTEDVYFCMKIRDLEPTPSICMNTSIQCGHLLNPEPIEWLTRKKFKDFYTEEVVATPQTGRGESYIAQCLAGLK